MGATKYGPREKVTPEQGEARMSVYWVTGQLPDMGRSIFANDPHLPGVI